MLPGIRTDDHAIPLVSIIIPAYNNEKFISAAVQSAVDQTWPNIEIIVIDDGSADSSYTIAKSFKNDRVKAYTQTNAGACAARNKGFHFSKGSFIQYLDADDILPADKIEQQMKLLSKYPEGFITSCAWGRFENELSEAIFITEAVWKDMQPVEWLTTAWSRGGMMQTACWLTPRQLIEKAGPWNESFVKNPIDDGEFFCRVLLQSKGIRYCEKARVYYRSHTGERVSTMSSRQSVQSVLQTYMSYEQHIKAHEISSRVVHALINNYATFMYRYYNTFPDLAAIAEQHIRVLGLNKIPIVGGIYFKKGAALIGFKTMLRLRSVFKNY